MIKGTRRKGSAAPEIIHKLWAKGKKARRELAKILLQCGGDKDIIITVVHYRHMYVYNGYFCHCVMLGSLHGEGDP